jgi:hypothetical protein
MQYFIASETDNFLQNTAIIVTIMSVFLGGVVSLLTMIGKVRGDIEAIRIELQKDRQYMESRITQLEAQVSKMRNQLTSLLLTLARNKIPLDDMDDK